MTPEDQHDAVRLAQIAIHEAIEKAAEIGYVSQEWVKKLKPQVDEQFDNLQKAIK